MSTRVREKKEVKTINNSKKIIEELNQIYVDGIYIDEYEKLLNEYEKLYHRYESTIKVSDSIGNSMMKKNETLNNSLAYTIKTARAKLFENVVEHKKTKSAFFSNIHTISKYKEILNELITEKAIVEKKLNMYIKYYGDIKNQFSEDINENISKDDSSSFNNIGIKKVIELAFKNNNTNQFLILLKLKNFDKIEKITRTEGSFTKFIDLLYNFLDNSLSNDSVVYYQDSGIFYVCVEDENIDNIKLIEKKINSKRDIYNLEIAFNVAISKYVKKDESIEKLLKKCDLGLEEAISQNKLVVK